MTELAIAATPKPMLVIEDPCPGVKKLLLDANRPSLFALSYVLRHKELWPKGFEWDYGYCHCCAMQIACELWPNSIREPSVSCVSLAFGMKVQDARDIFAVERTTANGGWAPYLRYGFLWLKKEADWSRVTPEMVANAIDDYIAAA